MLINRYSFIKYLAATSTVFFMGCGKTQFLPAPGYKSQSVLFEDSFKVESNEAQFIQPDLSENRTQLNFQIENPFGLLVQDLLKSQINITENGRPVNDIVLQKKSETSKNIVDIVFAVDVTVSMGPTIEAAKIKLIQFINTSRAKGYRTRMCLSTFGDYTFSKCSRFYNNDINDPTSAAEVQELVSEISKLKEIDKDFDPGDRDFAENPMRAVIDAAAAPWEKQSQRFVILVTDADFLILPSRPGVNPKATPPMYTEVIQAVKDSKMQVFGVTPSLPGYNQVFESQSSLVKASSGEWYSYSDLVTGKITLDTILDRILEKVDTTFSIEYNLTSQGDLDPSLPLSSRDIKLTLFDTVIGFIKNLKISSNLPNGREADPKSFVISNKKINPQFLEVFVDGIEQKNNFRLVDKKIEFNKAQKPNAKINIRYKYADLKDSILFRPIQFSLNPELLSEVEILVNDQVVEPKYYNIFSLQRGTVNTVVFSDEIFSETDPYGISQLERLDILIKLKSK